MPISKIKAEHKETYIAFGKDDDKLGYRDDIDDLAIIAQSSGDKSLKKLFEVLPSLEELKDAKTKAELKTAPAPAKPVESKK